MPIFSGFTISQQAHINVILSNQFLPVVGQFTWTKCLRTVDSFTSVEPYASRGTFPFLTKFDGSVKTQAIPSYKQSVPNQYYAAATTLNRVTDVWMDQTASSLYNLTADAGLQAFWCTEYLFYYRLLNGRVSGSNIYTDLQGNPWDTSIDGQPIFSANHTLGNVTGISNIIQGGLPKDSTTAAGTGTIQLANLIWQDMQSIQQRIRSYPNTNGAPIFPTLDFSKNVTVLCPPFLEVPMKLALSAKDALVSATTNIVPEMVQNVICSGLLSGCPLVDATGTITPGTITPPITSNTEPQLDYYVFITGWVTGAGYMQLFNPLALNQTFPGNFNPDAQIDRIMKDTGLNHQTASAMSMMLVETNFNQQGTNGDSQVMLTNTFTVAASMIGQVFFPSPHLIFRVIPSGGV